MLTLFRKRELRKSMRDGAFKNWHSVSQEFNLRPTHFFGMVWCFEFKQVEKKDKICYSGTNYVMYNFCWYRDR